METNQNMPEATGLLKIGHSLLEDLGFGHPAALTLVSADYLGFYHERYDLLQHLYRGICNLNETELHLIRALAPDKNAEHYFGRVPKHAWQESYYTDFEDVLAELEQLPAFGAAAIDNISLFYLNRRPMDRDGYHYCLHKLAELAVRNTLFLIAQGNEGYVYDNIVNAMFIRREGREELLFENGRAVMLA